MKRFSKKEEHRIGALAKVSMIRTISEVIKVNGFEPIKYYIGGSQSIFSKKPPTKNSDIDIYITAKDCDYECITREINDRYGLYFKSVFGKRVEITVIPESAVEYNDILEEVKI